MQEPFPSPVCLRWRNAGKDRPEKGKELINKPLAEALLKKLAFSHAEWNAFECTEFVVEDDFIFVKGTYFTPVASSFDSVMTASELSEILAAKEAQPKPDTWPSAKGSAWLDGPPKHVLRICVCKDLSHQLQILSCGQCDRCLALPNKDMKYRPTAAQLIVPIGTPFREEKDDDILLRLKIPLTYRMRQTPSRLLLLHCYQASHGKDNALARVKPGVQSEDFRDSISIEIYRKLTGDEMTTDHLLKSEMTNIIRRRVGSGVNPSPSLKKWLAERPAVVGPNVELLSPVGRWHPRAQSMLSAPPPAAGSLAASAAFKGKATGAFSSKTATAGVPILAANPSAGYGGCYDAKQEKLNRTPHPMHYDTTIRNMSSKVDPRRKELKPSISFSNRVPRLSSVDARDDSIGPRKTEMGRIVRNPRRQLPLQSMELMGMVEPSQSLADFRGSLGSLSSASFNTSFYRPVPRASASALTEADRRAIFDDRAHHIIDEFHRSGRTNPIEERLPDGSLIVRTKAQPASKPRPRSAPPRRPPAPRMPVPGEEFDPWILRSGIKNSFGQRLIDLFKDWDTDGSFEIDRQEFRAACYTPIPLKKWIGFPNATKAEIDKVFDYFDTDKSGTLNLLELDLLLRRLPSKPSGDIADVFEESVAPPSPSGLTSHPQRRRSSSPRSGSPRAASPRAASPRHSARQGIRSPSPRPPVQGIALDQPQSPLKPPPPPQLQPPPPKAPSVESPQSPLQLPTPPLSTPSVGVAESPQSPQSPAVLRIKELEKRTHMAMEALFSLQTDLRTLGSEIAASE